MREPKTKTDLPRWLGEQADFLENLVHYGEPDHTPRQFFQDVEVRETLADVRRVCARFGIEVESADVMAPQAALAIVGRALDQLDQQPDGLLSLREAAALLGYTEKGLRKIVARKGIQSFQSAPWAPIKFKREWLDEFIDRHTKQKRPVARPSVSFDEF